MESTSHRTALSEDAFYVGAWLVQPRLLTITRDGRPVHIEPKVMAVLVCLAERPGAVVSREHLHNAVWPDAIVTDNVLTRAVSELRKAFDDDPRDPQVIKTISKRGYQLIAPVTYPYAGDASPRASSVPDVPVTLSLPSTKQHLHLSRRSLLIAALLVSLGLVGIAGVLLTKVPAPSRLAVPLTTFPGHEVNPALSPDGNEVAFVWQGPAGDNWDLYVKQPGTETPLRLTDDPAEDVAPAWAPDGTRLAFLRYTDSTCAVMEVPALTGPARRLASCLWYPAANHALWSPGLAWSPDGRWLAFTDRPDDQQRPGLYLLSTETLATRPLTQPEAGSTADIAPAFSPDGAWVAFARLQESGSTDLYRVAVTNGAEQRLTTDHSMLWGLDWTPDSKHIIFSSNRGGTFGLWKLPAAGGKPSWLPASGWYVKAPALARRGHRMVYENWLYDTNLWRLSLRPDSLTAPKALASSTRWEGHPSYAPDGTRLAFVSNRSGSYEVWLCEADGTNPVQLTHFDDAVVGTPRWSPNGQMLVAEVRPNGQADLYQITTAGGPPQRLTSHTADDVNPTWSRDGQWLYFASDRDGTWQIWKMPAAGGEALPVTHHGGYAAAESSDGHFVYYAKNDTAGLWRLPLSEEDQAATQVLDIPTVGDWSNWILTDAGVYVVQRESQARAVLVFYDFTAHTVTEVVSLPQPPLLHQPALTLSPDGAWLIYTQLDQTESDLMLVETMR